MISAQLKSETRTAHTVTEGRLVRYLKSARSKADYTRLLQAFYGFLHPLEARITAHLDPAVLPDYETRRKSELLAEDLRVLGATIPPAEAEAPALPHIGSSAAALGALYVFEGSTLGGHAIINMLRKNIPLPDSAFHFFEGYGADTMTRWRAFVETLNQPVHLPFADEIVRAAQQTFTLFGLWLEEHLVHAAIEE